jgi:DNA-binding transcriptional MerR regulator
VTEAGLFRIGELSRRSGVSPELLRAWERRYDLLRPTRSSGGLRLYSATDLERVQAMQRHLARGLAAAEAAALAVQPDAGAVGAPHPSDAREELAAALAGFDEAAAHAVVDSLIARASLDAVLRDVVVPYLHDLGERWESGEVSVAQEHFASSVLRGRLLGLARGWGRGFGPLAVLACVPGERHDLGLLAFGLVLRGRGWRIAYLGADTPLTSLDAATRELDPDLVVLVAVLPDSLEPHLAQIRKIAKRHQLALGGAGLTEQGARRVGAMVLPADLLAAADEVTRTARRPG